MGLEIVGLCKNFGKRQGLVDVSLSVDNGVLVVLGPTGSGKSTLAAIVATLETASKGVVRLDGLDARKQRPEIRRRIGYAPENAQLFDHLTVRETLDYLALIQGMDYAPARKLRVDRALERLDLALEADRMLGTLPAGLARRVAVAQACLGQPSLVILDEPTAGIEPEDAVCIRAAITRLGQEAAVLLLSSAVADASIATGLAVLHQGRMRFAGTVQELVDRLEGKVWSLELAGAEPLPARSVFLPTRYEPVPGGTKLRGVAETPPVPGAVQCKPSLEDGYAWLLGRSCDGSSTQGLAAQ
jgi:ABC-2 type transport system ATP-binding protein